MYSHRKFCAKHLPEMCISRTDLPTFKIQLRPNYSLIEIEKIRKLKKPTTRPMAKIREFKLDIKYSGEYVARPLSAGGLDIIYNPRGSSMLSDQADFHFHEHEFEISKTIFFDHLAPVQKVTCSLEQGTKAFIGDVNLLTDKSGTHEYRTEAGGEYFNPMYMDDQLIGYSICERLAGYDVVSGNMHSDEGFYEEMIVRYTDRATQTVDGIMLAGLQNSNWLNFVEAVDCDIKYCPDCQLVNSKL